MKKVQLIAHDRFIRDKLYVSTKTYSVSEGKAKELLALRADDSNPVFMDIGSTGHRGSANVEEVKRDTPEDKDSNRKEVNNWGDAVDIGQVASGDSEAGITV